MIDEQIYYMNHLNQYFLQMRDIDIDFEAYFPANHEILQIFNHQSGGHMRTSVKRR